MSHFGTHSVFGEKRCVVKVHPSQDLLCLAGNDGIRRHSIEALMNKNASIDFEEPMITTTAGFDDDETLTDLAFCKENDSYYAASCSDGKAIVFSSDGSNSVPIAQFMVPCVSVDINANHYVVAASQDGQIKIQQIEVNPMTKEMRCNQDTMEYAVDKEDGIICCKFIRNDTIGVCGCNGRFSIWKIVNMGGNNKLSLSVQLLSDSTKLLPKIKGSELSHQRLVFDTMSSDLVVPCARDVCLVACPREQNEEAKQEDKEGKQLTVKQRFQDLHSSNICCLKVATSAQHTNCHCLAVGDVKGYVSVWQLTKKESGNANVNANANGAFDIVNILKAKRYDEGNDSNGGSIGSIDLKMSHQTSEQGTSQEVLHMFITDCNGHLYLDAVDIKSNNNKHNSDNAGKQAKSSVSSHNPNALKATAADGSQAKAGAQAGQGPKATEEDEEEDDDSDIDIDIDVKGDLFTAIVDSDDDDDSYGNTGKRRLLKKGSQKKEDSADSTDTTASNVDAPNGDNADNGNAGNSFASIPTIDAATVNAESARVKSENSEETNNQSSGTNRFVLDESEEKEENSRQASVAHNDQDIDLVNNDAKFMDNIDDLLDDQPTMDEMDDIDDLDDLNGVSHMDDMDDIGNEDSLFMPETDMAAAAAVSQAAPMAPTHLPFQINTTQYDDNGQRYLTWNEIGAVVARRASSDPDTLLKNLNIGTDMTSDELNSSLTYQYTYEIDFSDKSIYSRAIRFTDLRNYELAALNSNGLLLASNIDENNNDNDSSKNGSFSSVVSYRPFNSWGYTTQNTIGWQYNLSNNEKCVCIGLTPHYIVVATNKGYLRVFTSSGLQHNIVSLPGQAVNIVGNIKQQYSKYGVRQDVVAMTYDVGNSYSLNMMIVDLNNDHTIYDGSVSLTPFCYPNVSKLKWIYINGSGKQIITMDSQNMVRVLTQNKQFGMTRKVWMPLLDINGKIQEQIGMNGNSNNSGSPSPPSTMDSIELNLNGNGIESNDVDSFDCIPLLFDFDEMEQTLQLRCVLLPIYSHGKIKEALDYSVEKLKMASLSSLSIGIALITKCNLNLSGNFIQSQASIMRNDLLNKIGATTSAHHKKEEMKNYIKLFQKACEMRQIVLAFDIATVYLRHSLKAVNSCLKIAMHMKMPNLAEKLNQFLSKVAANPNPQQQHPQQGHASHNKTSMHQRSNTSSLARLFISNNSSNHKNGSNNNSGNVGSGSRQSNNSIVGKKRSLQSAGLTDQDTNGHENTASFANGKTMGDVQMAGQGMMQRNQHFGPPPAKKRNPFSKGR